MRRSVEATAFIAAVLAACMAVTSHRTLARARHPQVNAGAEQGRTARPNVLFVITDTTRADRFVGVRSAAAWLKRQPGTEFNNAWSQAPTTNSSVATIFTGLLPSQHGVFDGGGALPREAGTLAEFFLAAGYSTAHITANPNSGPAYGLDRGFRHVRWSGRGPASDLLNQQLQHGSAIGSLALDFLKDVREPFLLSLHFNDPHSPYDPVRAPASVTGVRRIYDEPSSDPSVGRVTAREHGDLMARYDAEIAEVDRALSRVVQRLEQTGAWRRTVLVVTSDHGEEFQDHGGWGHSHSLFPELLHVPLFIRQPGDSARRIQSGRINHADLLPTLLELTGLPPAARLWGRSRASLMRSGDGAAERTIAEKLSSEKGGPLRSLITDQLALIERQNDGRLELYDRTRDPGQRQDIAAVRPREVERLHQDLEDEIRATRRPGVAKTATIDADTLRHLQSLGYLQGRTAAAGPAPDRADQPAPAIRTILNTRVSARTRWSALSSGDTIAADNSTRGFQVELEIPVGAGTARRVRLRFAAAEHATTISEVTVKRVGSTSRAQPVTFGGRTVRRFPPGAVIESDPFPGPAADRWIVTFRSEPLGLVRIAKALRSKLTPLEKPVSGSSSAASESIDGVMGLIAIVDDRP